MSTQSNTAPRRAQPLLREVDRVPQRVPVADARELPEEEALVARALQFLDFTDDEYPVEAQP